MRVAIAALAGLAPGITAATYGRRYAFALCWWLWTADVRSTQ
jgi:hypothetical protein